MTIDEIKKSLELLKAEIEWDKSIEYQVTIDDVLKLLEELKAVKEMDLDIPQHFTKEQSDWIKLYCIKMNKEFYNQALDDLFNRFREQTAHRHMERIDCLNELEDIAEQLKEQKNE